MRLLVLDCRKFKQIESFQADKADFPSLVVESRYMLCILMLYSLYLCFCHCSLSISELDYHADYYYHYCLSRRP